MTSLSNSVLWQRMHDYYDQLGTEIWEDEVVPLQITSNTSLANTYAKLIIAQMHDYIAKYGQPTSDEPFYIIEIGAGHGRLSFYLLKNLQLAFKLFNWPSEWLKYVMTDISRKSLTTWQNHHALKPFIDSKNLDMAVFNALSDTELNLVLSQQTIKPNTLKKPLFVVCNYLFDTLVQDAFQVIDGRMHEVELVIKNEAKLDQENLKDYFKKAKYEYLRHPVSCDYYQDYPLLNTILQDYETEFENAAFLMPLGAMKCIKNLKQLTQSPLMFLVSDKGITDTELFEENDDPDITFHGSVSMMVNFDALKRYTDLSKGTSFLMGNKGADFQVASFVYQTDYDIPNTAYAFTNSLGTFSPQDLFDICYINDEPNPAFKSLEALINLLNMADWDPCIFYDYHPMLLEKLEAEEYTQEDELSILNGLKRAWAFFFKLEKDQDIPFAIGAILYNMDHFDKAIEFYQASLKYFGQDKETYFNIALVYQADEKFQLAAEALQQALSIDPHYRDAKKLLKELKQESHTTLEVACD